jgi:hypothetical protein
MNASNTWNRTVCRMNNSGYLLSSIYYLLPYYVPVYTVATYELRATRLRPSYSYVRTVSVILSLIARGEIMLQYVLKIFVGSVVVVVSDPCRVATFSVIGSCFLSKVFVNMKSDIVLSKSMHPLAVGAVGAVGRGFVQ